MMTKRATADLPPAHEAEWEASSDIAPSNTAEAVSVQDDPLTFLLNSVSDAVNLWSADGELLYRNRVSGCLDGVLPAPTRAHETLSDVESLDVLGHRFERRYLRCHIERQDYLLEVIRDLG